MSSLVVATGRFQWFHLGSLDYMQSAMSFAYEEKARLYVVSGPFDHQLFGQGYKRPNSYEVRRPLRFSERQFLLSCALGVPAGNIFASDSTPHHTRELLDRYISSFFDPLVDRRIIRRNSLVSLEAGSEVVMLATVKKSEDLKIYGGRGGARHYSDCLKEAYPAIIVHDVQNRCALPWTQEGSGLPRSLEELVLRMPPIAAAAEILVRAGRRVDTEESQSILQTCHQRFGCVSQSLETLLLSDPVLASCVT